MLLSCNSYAQKVNKDSLKESNEIELVRSNVQEFIKNQHKRFTDSLKGLNQEYAIYFMPQYSGSGRLLFEDPEYRFGTTNQESVYGRLPYRYYKPTSFEKPLNLPWQVLKYSMFLLNRTDNNWCEEKFGYKNLERGDEFGLLLIFSPKNIQDSLSVLKVKWYTPSEYETASEDKKRMMDLTYKIGRYGAMGYGLKERLVTILLKY